jgi:hypothetical protein
MFACNGGRWTRADWNPRYSNKGKDKVFRRSRVCRVRFCDHGSENESKTVGVMPERAQGVVSGVTGLQ